MFAHLRNSGTGCWESYGVRCWYSCWPQGKKTLELKHVKNKWAKDFPSFGIGGNLPGGGKDHLGHYVVVQEEHLHRISIKFLGATIWELSPTFLMEEFVNPERRQNWEPV